MATWLLAVGAAFLAIGVFFWPGHGRNRDRRIRRCPECGEATLGTDDVCWFCDWRGRSRLESEQRQAQRITADTAAPPSTPIHHSRERGYEGSAASPHRHSRESGNPSFFQ